jgi:hypothetical protein
MTTPADFFAIRRLWRARVIGGAIVRVLSQTEERFKRLHTITVAIFITTDTKKMLEDTSEAFQLYNEILEPDIGSATAKVDVPAVTNERCTYLLNQRVAVIQ